MNRQNLPELNISKKEFFKYTTENPLNKNLIHKLVKAQV